MEPSDYVSFDAVGLADLVARDEVTADELLDAALRVAETRNPLLNAIVTSFEGSARDAIRSGLPDGPLRGVPYAIKDLWAGVAGIATTNGSRLYRDWVPDHDSEMVARYRRAGLVLFAKTNTPELGLCPTTEPVLFGPTLNPWDRSRSAGGSSGGAAAAVAGGIVPAAHATDGGGSIRIPASCCGLFGLKPSRGRVSLAPDRGEGWGGMSTQHAVSRSVRDSAALLDAVAGPAAGDPYSAPAPDGPYLRQTTVAPERLRVGVCVASPGGVPVDPSCRAAAESTASRLEALGHSVREVGWPFSPDLLAVAQSSIIAANTAVAVDDRLASQGVGPSRTELLEPVTAAIVEWGRRTSATDYVRAVNAAHSVGRSLAGLFGDIDLLVTPTTACLPPYAGTLDGQDVERFIRGTAPLVTFTSVFNLSGQPAATVPLDRTDDGVPLGTQIVAAYGREDLLFGVAAQLEAAHPWPLVANLDA